MMLTANNIFLKNLKPNIMKKLTKTQEIINDVLMYGTQYYEIGSFKTVKNSNSIKAAIKTGKVKLGAHKLNFYGTGYEWVELEKA